MYKNIMRFTKLKCRLLLLYILCYERMIPYKRQKTIQQNKGESGEAMRISNCFVLTSNFEYWPALLFLFSVSSQQAFDFFFPLYSPS